ncbi:MAG: proteasome endopeptidase complex, archaeal, beta subunit [Desulfurococcales archaeon ex4484_217_1]|nr:MAG: proteasome endopeptidase complex, archaeal, beta subunit [Desulfurococcales archaeon ex4484_217_1]
MSREYFGATTIGIKCSNGVILASERRMSYGGYILSKRVKKVFKITDKLAVAFAGLFADMQALAKLLEAEVKLYELTMNKSMNVRSVAKILSIMLYRQKNMPYLSEALVGGADNEGFHLFILDPLGSVIEDNYAAIGTGAPIAIGIIESAYKDKINVEEARKLAYNAIKAAIERDATSGDGIDIMTITEEGIYEEFKPIA